MRTILNQHIVNPQTEPSTAATRSASFRTIQQQLEFQIQIIQNLGARSKANEERLRNEINLVVLFSSSDYSTGCSSIGSLSMSLLKVTIG